MRLAIERELVDVQLHNIRDWAHDKHRQVDDRPYGGGPGMVLKVEPVVECVEAVRAMAPEPGHLIMLTPQGRRLDQNRGRAGRPPMAAAPVRAVSRVLTIECVRFSSRMRFRSAITFWEAAKSLPWQSSTPWPDWSPACWEMKKVTDKIRSRARTGGWSSPSSRGPREFREGGA